MGINYSSLLREINRNENKSNIVDIYSKHDRYIPHDIYKRLKAKRQCEECGRKLHHLPKIHHKIPRCEGGSNNRVNLKAVCTPCHDKLDKEFYERKEDATRI